MGKIILATGGVRSGKSSFILNKATENPFSPKKFIATAEVCDDEMQKRKENHQAERGKEWQTVEAGVELTTAVNFLPDECSAVIDCLTVWLGNVWYRIGESDEVFQSEIEKLLEALKDWKEYKSGEISIVTNEVGWGIVPENAAVRQYRDWAGRLNQLVAAISDEVYLVVSGIPHRIK